MIYLFIIGWSLAVAVILMFFAGAGRNGEHEIPEPVEDKKIDAEMAYLESQYGLDDYVRGLRGKDD